MEASERIASFLPAAWRRRVAACGGTVHEVDGLAVCLTGVPVNELNPTFVDGEVADPAVAVTIAESLYPAKVSFGIDLDPGLDVEVRAAVAAIGLALLETRPAMAVTVADVPAVPAPDDVELFRVTDPALLDEVARVDAAAFGGDPAMTRRFVPDAVLADPAQRVYAARVGEDLVAAGETALVDGVLGVSGVATVPAFRRRGIGAAMTALQVADRRAEAEIAVLHASEAGFGVYERLGFRTVTSREIWVRNG